VYALCGAGSLRATARGLNKQIKNGGDEETQLKTAVWVENIQNTAGIIDASCEKKKPIYGRGTRTQCRFLALCPVSQQLSLLLPSLDSES